MRFLLDENFPQAPIAFLKGAGHKALDFVPETNLAMTSLSV